MLSTLKSSSRAVNIVSAAAFHNALLLLGFIPLTGHLESGDQGSMSSSSSIFASDKGPYLSGQSPPEVEH